MKVNVKGKLIKTLVEKSGESQKGAWYRYSLLIKNIEEEEMLVVGYFGGDMNIVDKIKALVPEQEVNLLLDINAREWKDAWYNNVNIDRFIEVYRGDNAAPVQQQQQEAKVEDKAPEAANNAPNDAMNDADDCPF